MKLTDFMFRDIRLFIQTFTHEQHSEEIYEIVKDLSLYKWGISESGPGGRIVVCVDNKGEISCPLHISSLPSSWTVFFAFSTGIGAQAPVLPKADFLLDCWSQTNALYANSGIEVALDLSKGKLELINAVRKK